MDALNILTLLHVPNFGRATAREIVSLVGHNPSNIHELHSAIKYCNERTTRIKVPDLVVLNQSFILASEVLHRAKTLGIHVLALGDPRFPAKLRGIKNNPVLLFAKGDLGCLNGTLSVGVVGTRNPSEYGRRCAFRFGVRFAERGVVVVSGLARGVDTEAHLGCLEQGGKTVAVLAHGLDVPVYPPENAGLANRIVESGGCLLSEYSLGVKSTTGFFVDRDRLQAGLSDGVVVVETGSEGGTMHTVNFCMEQGKPLGCLVHPEKFRLRNSKVEGNLALLNTKKAFPLSSLTDIDAFTVGL